MSEEIYGKYFGTEIDQKWWKRYKKDKMLARGNGIFSYNDQSISFLRQLTRIPIEILFEDIVEFKIGKWHAGQWGAGQPIIKAVWEKEGRILSSGFSFSGKPEATTRILVELENRLHMKRNKK